MGHRNNPIRDITKRMEREIRHNDRAIEERSKTISGFENIERIEIYFYGSGGYETPQDNFVVYFQLKNPILYKDFDVKIREKLKELIIK